MKNLFSFQGAPMTVVIAMIAWSWFSVLSVVIGSLF